MTRATHQPMRVLVTSAGAGPAIAIIKAIKRSASGDSNFVVAVDANAASAGLFLADAQELIPRSDSAQYIPRLLEVCLKFDVQLLIPILDLETPVVAANVSEFERIGVAVAVNSPECLARCNDKIRSSEVCARSAITQPRTFLRRSDIPTDCFPIVAKSICGTGSVGQYLFAHPEELAAASIDDRSVIFQEFVSGTEYSIDTFGEATNPYFVAVPRERRKVKGGQTVHGIVTDDDALKEYARRCCHAFGITDVSCIQVIRDKGGVFYFIEINPRYGTGVSLSIAAGVDFPRLQFSALLAPYALPNIARSLTPGVQMVRYWEEIFLTIDFERI